ncbi:hypothetical protein PMAYCL1PPCAC_06256, partial [Pristionchus mayeri]
SQLRAHQHPGQDDVDPALRVRIARCQHLRPSLLYGQSQEHPGGDRRLWHGESEATRAVSNDQGLQGVLGQRYCGRSPGRCSGSRAYNLGAELSPRLPSGQGHDHRHALRRRLRDGASDRLRRHQIRAHGHQLRSHCWLGDGDCCRVAATARGHWSQLRKRIEN